MALAPGRRIDRAFRGQQGGPFVAEQDEERFCTSRQCSGQTAGRQVVELPKIGALGLGFVHQLGQRSASAAAWE